MTGEGGRKSGYGPCGCKERSVVIVARRWSVHGLAAEYRPLIRAVIIIYW
jgi:hypothetical protein